jgi:hypothetical protein
MEMAVNPLCSYLDKKEDSSVNCVSLSTDLCTTDIFFTNGYICFRAFRVFRGYFLF